MSDQTPTLPADERLFAAFMQWWWFDSLIPGFTIADPDVGDMESIAEDFHSLLSHLAEHGYSIVYDTADVSDVEDGAA